MTGRLTKRILAGYGKMSSKGPKLLVSVIMLMNYLTVLTAAQSTTVVDTTSGPVQGEVLNTVDSMKYAAFKGIRYAEAPVGYLRFKPPVPVKPWTNTYNATAEGNDCPQMDFGTKVFSGAEDCLFINIYTPVITFGPNSTVLKSVMVSIHGGGFTIGSSSIKILRPDYLLQKDLVVVALNYRLGALGFLGMGHPNATGNAGLKDQVLGLKWVQANIEKFGGDPKNVTIIGESAGAASIGYLVLSDAAAGLFHGAISMSGAPLNPWAFQTPAVALSQAVKLGALIGAVSTNKDTLLKAFYKASAFQLVNASSDILLMGLLPFTPTIEDKKISTDVFLATCSVVKYITGNFSKVPQMLGFTDRETISVASFLKPFFDVNAEVLKAVEKFNMGLPGSIGIVQNATKTSTNIAGQLTDTIVETFINQSTALLFKTGIDQTQRLLEANNNNNSVYYYHVSFYPKGRRNIVNPITNHSFEGAGHGEDILYLFYAPTFNFSTDPTDPTRRTINRVTTMWTNFAKYGNPTPSWVPDNILNIVWPNSGPSGQSLDIGTELKVGPRPIDDFTKLVQLLSWPVLGNANGCS